MSNDAEQLQEQLVDKEEAVAELNERVAHAVAGMDEAIDKYGEELTRADDAEKLCLAFGEVADVIERSDMAYLLGDLPSNWRIAMNRFRQRREGG